MEKYNFTVLSIKKCIDCNQPLKQNLVDKNPDALRYWICFNIKFSKSSRSFLIGWFKWKQKKMKAKFAN